MEERAEYGKCAADCGAAAKTLVLEMMRLPPLLIDRMRKSAGQSRKTRISHRSPQHSVSMAAGLRLCEPQNNSIDCIGFRGMMADCFLWQHTSGVNEPGFLRVVPDSFGNASIAILYAIVQIKRGHRAEGFVVVAFLPESFFDVFFEVVEAL